jgi:hypothetical protein
MSDPHWHDTDEFIRLRDARVAKMLSTSDEDRAGYACPHMPDAKMKRGVYLVRNFVRNRARINDESDDAFTCKTCAEHIVELQLLRLREKPSE